MNGPSMHDPDVMAGAMSLTGVETSDRAIGPGAAPSQPTLSPPSSPSSGDPAQEMAGFTNSMATLGIGKNKAGMGKSSSSSLRKEMEIEMQ